MQPNNNNTMVAKEEAEEEYDRGQWGSKAEFLLSCIGYSVGIGNIWRFPYLAYENGGGAFLLPYIILLILIGKPMYYMELALGQYSQLGPLAVWKMLPAAKGIGFGMLTVSFIIGISYNVLIAYSIFFIAASFTSELPWSQCYEWWGADENCYVRDNTTAHLPLCSNINFTGVNATGLCLRDGRQTASEQYWQKYVLGFRQGGIGSIGDIGVLKWDLVLCLLLAWIIVFFCLMKGIKSSGKVVYVTATLPYVILVILLILGLTLEGSSKGLYYFFIPNFNKLADVTVWRNAATQMFYSLGISWGGTIVFGSYSPFRNRVHTDAMIISFMDTFTSIIGGMVIFSILGAMATELNVPIQHVVTSGQGLAFIVYPEALSRLPVPQLWSVIFFAMLLTLGLDSEFAMLETILTGIYDEFPRSRKYKVACTGILCAVSFLIGLPCVSNAGAYVFHLMDNFGGSLGVTIIAIFEISAIMWGYGVNRFSKDMEFMLGFKTSWYWRICWAVLCPGLLIVIFLASTTSWENPKLDGLEYPGWALGVGWCLTAASFIHIPLWLLGTTLYYRHKGDVKQAFKPLPSWGPGDKVAREELLAMDKNLPMEKMGHDNPAAIC